MFPCLLPYSVKRGQLWLQYWKVFFPSFPLCFLNSDKYRYHICNYSADFISVTVPLVWATHSVVRDTSLCPDNHFPVPPTLRHHLPSSSLKYATLLCQCNSKSNHINKLLYRFLLPISILIFIIVPCIDLTNTVIQSLSVLNKRIYLFTDS